jgi:serralysin
MARTATNCRFKRTDLSPMDANGNPLDGNQAFIFIGGEGFHGVPGELRTLIKSELVSIGGGVFVVVSYDVASGDVDGVGLADFEIAKPNTVGLVGTDFIL